MALQVARPRWVDARLTRAVLTKATEQKQIRRTRSYAKSDRRHMAETTPGLGPS